MAVLITGGAGFIGSHTAVELINSGYDVVIADNLSNSDENVVSRIEKITGRRPAFYNIDVNDRGALGSIFDNEGVDAVIHCAGYKAVGESVQKPYEYYQNNLGTALGVISEMKSHDVKRLIFSSSATVYSASDRVPYTEKEKKLGCTNPYGWTKYMIEQIIKDVVAADEGFSAVILRYFNPIGAHESGLLGEKPSGTPNNLMPYITQVAAGIREKLYVFGDDYPTHDGTGVRDYIHITDLARGHVAAYEYSLKKNGCEIINLGTGHGYSVLDIVSCFARVNGVEIPYEFAVRREGDIATCYASTEKAERLLGWKAEKTLEDMCRDAWNWQKNL